MKTDMTMILGFGLLAGGAYLYTKGKKPMMDGSPERPSEPIIMPQMQQMNPIVDQGKEDGVAPDAPSTGSGPAFPNQLAPESAAPDTGSVAADTAVFDGSIARRWGFVRSEKKGSATQGFVRPGGAIIS